MLRSLVASLLCSMMLLALGARADSRTDFLVEMVLDADQFRVRTQAALALGSRPSEPAAVRALTQALRDEHPAVRAASASSLERLGEKSALSALRSARKDRDPAVRSAVERAITALERPAPAAVSATQPTQPSNATYYVAVGTPSSQLGLASGALRGLREHVVRQVAGLGTVRIAPENESQSAASSVLRSAKLTGYYLDSSVTKVELKPDGALRAQVSIIVGTYPGRAMRVMLSGAATVSGGGSGDQAKVQAIEAAFTGALRRLPQALEAGLARAD
jgi:HEAT repeat protein